jgi:hypothetical protein
MNIDSKFIFYISFSDNPEALINAVFLNNGTYFVFFLSMCDVKIFLTFTSPNMVLL